MYDSPLLVNKFIQDLDAICTVDERVMYHM